MSVPPNVLEWLRLADNDLGAAMLLARGGRFQPLACYHAQRSAEKCIKAVLTAVNQPFPRSHDLDWLFQLYPATAGPYALDQVDLLALTPYADQVRYPGFVPVPTLADARRAILIACRVRRASRRRLGM